MSTGDIVEGIPGVLVKVGLGQPMSRAFVAGAIVGAAAYALRMPETSFDEDGNMRPFKGTSNSPYATYSHFLIVPLTAAGLAYVFT